MNAPGTPILSASAGLLWVWVACGLQISGGRRPSRVLRCCAYWTTEYGIRELSCHALEAIFGHLSGTDFVFPLFVWVELILRLCLPSCTGTLAWSQLDDSRDALPTKTCSSWHRIPSTRYGSLCIS
ncbi:hypothetical protein V8C44DRAFT_338053 [Trichoderma aethiopicum]